MARMGRHCGKGLARRKFIEPIRGQAGLGPRADNPVTRVELTYVELGWHRNWVEPSAGPDIRVVLI